MLKKLKNNFSQRGAANIPIIIGLLLIGVALPAALRLVQQQQETRRGAAYEECPYTCSSVFSCGNCIGQYDCGSGSCCCAPRPTSAPTATPQLQKCTKPNYCDSVLSCPDCKSGDYDCASGQCCCQATTNCGGHEHGDKWCEFTGSGWDVKKCIAGAEYKDASCAYGCTNGKCDSGCKSDGGNCTYDGECCSGTCKDIGSRKVCAGEPTPKPCTSPNYCDSVLSCPDCKSGDYDCASGQCCCQATTNCGGHEHGDKWCEFTGNGWDVMKCIAGAELTDASCAYGCSNGVCDSGCKADGKGCSYDGECCSGTCKDIGSRKVCAGEPTPKPCTSPNYCDSVLSCPDCKSGDYDCASGQCCCQATTNCGGHEHGDKWCEFTGSGWDVMKCIAGAELTDASCAYGCSNGVCDSGCKADGKGCSYDGECCSGTCKDIGSRKVCADVLTPTPTSVNIQVPCKVCSGQSCILDVPEGEPNCDHSLDKCADNSDCKSPVKCGSGEQCKTKNNCIDMGWNPDPNRYCGKTFPVIGIDKFCCMPYVPTPTPTKRPCNSPYSCEPVKLCTRCLSGEFDCGSGECCCWWGNTTPTPTPTPTSTPWQRCNNGGCGCVPCLAPKDCQAGLECVSHWIPALDDVCWDDEICMEEPTETPTPTSEPKYTCETYCLPRSECQIPGEGTCPGGDICCDMPKPFVTATVIPTATPTPGGLNDCETYCLPRSECRIPGEGICPGGDICCDMPKSFVTATAYPTATPTGSINKCWCRDVCSFKSSCQYSVGDPSANFTKYLICNPVYCEGLPEPTNTPVPPVEPTNTPVPPVEPTNTPVPPVEPTNTAAPPVEPTSTPGGEGCKPCPDGTYAPRNTSSYTCNTSGDQFSDFQNWIIQFRDIRYNGVNVPEEEMYGDYNCDGSVMPSDHSLWYGRFIESFYGS